MDADEHRDGRDAPAKPIAREELASYATLLSLALRQNCEPGRYRSSMQQAGCSESTRSLLYSTYGAYCT